MTAASHQSSLHTGGTATRTRVRILAPEWTCGKPVELQSSGIGVFIHSPVPRFTSAFDRSAFLTLHRVRTTTIVLLVQQLKVMVVAAAPLVLPFVCKPGSLRPEVSDGEDSVREFELDLGGPGHKQYVTDKRGFGEQDCQGQSCVIA